MTKDTFEREQKHRQEFKETQRETKRPKPDHRSSGDLPQVAKPVMQPRELVIDGIRFQLKDDGSKLIRIHGQSSSHRTFRTGLNCLDLANAGEDTPRKAKVADVEFLRTKNGNLVRVTSQHGDHRYYQRRSDSVFFQDSPHTPYRSAKRTKKAQCENFTKYGTRSPILIYAGGARATTCEVPIARWTSVSRVQWILTCSTGTCSFGPSCKFAHNPTKVAICKELMRNGSCHSRKTCDMSHELTYHRVPACTHFLRGNCTNSACRYPHVYVSPTARVCRAFATLGFCAKGPDCDDRHVFECPDYANHGHCAALEKGSCSLQHIDRAGALRKAEKRQGKIDPQDDSDMTSDEEEEEQDEQEDGHKQAAYDSESDVDTDIELGSSGFEQQDFMALS